MCVNIAWLRMLTRAASGPHNSSIVETRKDHNPREGGEGGGDELKCEVAGEKGGGSEQS